MRCSPQACPHRTLTPRSDKAQANAGRFCRMLLQKVHLDLVLLHHISVRGSLLIGPNLTDKVNVVLAVIETSCQSCQALCNIRCRSTCYSAYIVIVIIIIITMKTVYLFTRQKLFNKNQECNQLCQGINFYQGRASSRMYALLFLQVREFYTQTSQISFNPHSSKHHIPAYILLTRYIAFPQHFSQIM